MFTLRLRSLWLLVFCLVVLAASSTAMAKKPPPPDDPPPTPPVKYQIVWLPGPSLDSGTCAFDINALGTVVGSTGWYWDGRALLWDVTAGGTCEDLNIVLEDWIPANHVLTSAQCISNNGRIVGYCTHQSGERRVFAYDPLVPHITIVEFPDSAYGRFSIYDVNDGGTVVGQRDLDGNNNGEVPMGVVWYSAVGPAAVDLSTGCKLTGINNNNLIVGVVWDSDRAGSRDVFRVDSNNLDEREYLGKAALLFPTNPYGYGWPVINDQETVAACVLAGRRDKWWFGSYYANGLWTTLTEEGPAMVSDINDQGDIVGRRKPNAESRPKPAFVYLAGVSGLVPGQYWDLDEQIVELQGEVDSFWLTGSAAAEQSISDLTPDTDPNGTGYSMIAGSKELYGNNVFISCAYVLVPNAPDP